MTDHSGRVERAAVGCANRILRTFAPKYAAFIAGAIEYGMRAAADDAKHDRPSPNDWRANPETDA